MPEPTDAKFCTGTGTVGASRMSTATFTGQEFGVILVAVFAAGYLIGYLHAFLAGEPPCRHVPTTGPTSIP